MKYIAILLIGLMPSFANAEKTRIGSNSIITTTCINGYLFAVLRTGGDRVPIERWRVSSIVQMYGNSKGDGPLAHPKPIECKD